MKVDRGKRREAELRSGHERMLADVVLFSVAMIGQEATISNLKRQIRRIGRPRGRPSKDYVSVEDIETALKLVGKSGRAAVRQELAAKRPTSESDVDRERKRRMSTIARAKKPIIEIIEMVRKFAIENGMPSSFKTDPDWFPPAVRAFRLSLKHREIK